MTYVLGLTGGIASGKSTVSQVFKELNVPVIDADRVAREVVEPGTEGLAKVVDIFGESILEESGNLNRKELGRIIFNSPNKREQLNRILHPLIREKILNYKAKLTDKAAECIVLDLPLLFETDYVKECDGTMVVYVPKPIQQQRLMSRDDITKDEADKKINAQLSLDEKVKLADFVIDNSGTKKETEKQVIDWHASLPYQ